MWTLGIDPGLGETGLCLLDSSGKPVAGATIRAEGASTPDLVRYIRLARAVLSKLVMWTQRFEIDILLIGIETPVLKKGNAVNYRKQCSTIAVIESLLAELGDSIVEINPTTAKLAATNDGAAVKAEIVAASPFKGGGPSVEAMADAWAIAIAARLLRDKAVDCSKLEDRGYSPFTEEIL